jgi:hypothetical protein
VESTAGGAATVRYTVASGDTLGAIALRLGASIEALMQANGIVDPNAIYVGQELVWSSIPSATGPSTLLVPDSEIVLGPAYTAWDWHSEAARWQGRIASHTEPVDGVPTTGLEIVTRIAYEHSLGPRVLLAFLEAQSGWVLGPGVAGMETYPAGLQEPGRAGLWWQLSWLAEELSRGFYDWSTRDQRSLVLADGTLLAGAGELNAGSFAVQRAIGALSTSADDFDARLAGFQGAYARLFGDPWGRELPLAEPRFPALDLPWQPGEAWWFTGGPHGGWLDASAWSAIDFVPPGDVYGCYTAPNWVTAAAPGRVLIPGDGMLLLDLDGDGHRTTGPVLFHLHIAAEDRAPEGSVVERGDRLGHPSCQGGRSTAIHLHIGRLYDGRWLPATDPQWELGGWRVGGAESAYDGTLSRGSERREACECREPGFNDIRR